MSLLQVQNLTCCFGSLVAVDNVSLTVEPGELRAIIGPNGAGKTTFFNLISGFVRPTSGRVVYDGQDVTSVTPGRRVIMGMARTFQITEIFPELSVYDNVRVAVEVALGQRLRPWIWGDTARRVRDRINELMTMTDLLGSADRLAGELSHGDQRSIEIAMALALEPRLLLLDEPTAGMGEQETYNISKLIRRLHRKQGLSIVLIEHDMRVVFNLADRITVLAQGAVLADGSPSDVAGSEVVQSAYLGKAA